MAMLHGKEGLLCDKKDKCAYLIEKNHKQPLFK